MTITDTIASHPKIIRAGELIGGASGRAEALAAYVASIGYARHYLTNGHIPDSVVTRDLIGSRGKVLAKALSDRNVKLWERTRNGYRIHDFHAFNDSADKLKHKRELTRARVAAHRARHSGNGK